MNQTQPPWSSHGRRARCPCSGLIIAPQVAACISVRFGMQGKP